MAAALRRTPAVPFFRRRISPLSTTTAAGVPDVISSTDAISAAKSAIRSESDPDRLAALFESAARHPSFHRDRPIYHISIRKLAQRFRPDLIERLLEGAKSDPKAPKSEGFLLRLLSLYASAGMLDHAVRIFEAMPELGCRHSQRSLCALLSAFLKNNRVDRLQDAFDRAAQEYGIAPGIACYNLLLQALCLNDEVEKARSLLDEMPERGIKPDIICCNTVLDGYVKKGNFAGFEELLKEMGSKNLKPNAGTYSVRMAALCAQGKTFEAEELLDAMNSEGIEPSRTSFNTLMDGFRKEGNMESAMQVLGRMKAIKRRDGSCGISPNFNTYVVLLQGLIEKGEFERALDICKECLERKWPPPSETVKRLTDGLTKNSHVEEARDLVERMASRGQASEPGREVEEEEEEERWKKKNKKKTKKKKKKKEKKHSPSET